ncbi:sialidase family protein [Thermopirellula anaerolimosa]
MRATLTVVILLSCASLGFCTALGFSDEYPRETVVFAEKENGYFAYRIPAVLTAADGSVLAFAEARKYNLSDPGGKGQDIDLVVKRSRDGGRSWLPMQVIEDAGEYWSAANPAPLLDRRTGRVWLFYVRCEPGRGSHEARPGTDDVRNLIRFSDDHGATWSEPIDVTRTARDYDDPQWRVTIPGPGGAVQSSTGRLIVPCWKYAPYRNFTLYSDDHGKTWQRGEILPNEEGADESQLVQRCDGVLWMDCRQQTGPRRLLFESRDDGTTWAPIGPGQAVTPVMCAVERLTCRADGGDHNRIVFSGPRGPGRKGLTLWTLYDDDREFKNPRSISDGPAAYSDLTVLPDGTLGVLWEKGTVHPYQQIVFTCVNLSWLEPK